MTATWCICAQIKEELQIFYEQRSRHELFADIWLACWSEKLYLKLFNCFLSFFLIMFVSVIHLILRKNKLSPTLFYSSVHPYLHCHSFFLPLLSLTLSFSSQNVSWLLPGFVTTEKHAAHLTKISPTVDVFIGPCLHCAASTFNFCLRIGR